MIFAGLRLGQAAKGLGTQLVLLGLRDYADAEWLHRRYLERAEASQHRDADLWGPERNNADCR